MIYQLSYRLQNSLLMLGFVIGLVINLPFLPLMAYENSPAKIRLLYHAMDKNSISKHLALYELYPDTAIGQQALKDVWELLSGTYASHALQDLSNIKMTIEGVINLVNKMPGEESPTLEEATLACIERLSAHFPHKALKGHLLWTEEEIIALPSSDVDLARGLFLSELENDTQSHLKIRSYEAILDLMALQILTRLPSKASDYEKIRAMNDYIFFEMGFRFPAHSIYAKDIDLYSFLPSVIDSRKGVCLGVSILYLCLSQRLGVPLEIVTPPGHIFVRYQDAKKQINIETTARGINLPDEVYLSVDTRSLQIRSIKETIGMAHYNQAAVHWQKEDHHKALISYHKAQRYLPDDMQLKELMGYNYLFAGEIEKGTALMQEVKNHLFDYSVSRQTIPEDFLNGRTNIEGIRAVFLFTEDHRDSLLKKKDALEKVLVEHPTFRAGLLSLASTWIQLHRAKEALKELEKYHALDDSNPSVEYYLAELYAQRLDYQLAWKHFEQAEQITLARQHSPKALKEFKQKLATLSPQLVN